MTQTVTMDVYPDAPLTLDRLLRRLDIVRQGLAVRWCGIPGAFAGYDQLDLADEINLSSGTVILEARLIRASSCTHTVELVAATGDPESRVLVRGVGQTIQRPTSPG